MTTVSVSQAWRSARVATKAGVGRQHRKILLLTLITWIATHLPTRQSVLRFAGLACLCTAAFLFSPIAGLAAVGVALLLLEWTSDSK